tara:strand:+ start:625 stop:840 length:216 start_codon:yes stop_codon:yes gene_type:complete
MATKSRRLKQQIQAYYESTGYNLSDLQKYLIDLCNCGYSVSYDGSLLVAYLDNLTVVCGNGDLIFMIGKSI